MLFLAALLFGYLFFCIFIARERVFVAYKHEAWRWSDFHVPSEILTPYASTGPLPRIDWVYVVSYAPLVQRRADVKASFLRLGVKDLSFHYDWDRQRVLKEKRLISKTMFRDAVNLRMGGTVKEYTLGKRVDRAFENHDLRDRAVTEVRMCVCVCVCISVCICMFACMCVYAHIHKHTYTYTCIYTIGDSWEGCQLHAAPSSVREHCEKQTTCGADRGGTRARVCVCVCICVRMSSRE
jgi:hypothetical protein